MTPSGLVLLDSHAHLHPWFDRREFFERAADNLSRAARDIGPEGEANGVLVLTEPSGVEEFEALLDAVRTRERANGWEGVHTDERESLLIRKGSRRLFLVAGRQIATEERLEVLAVGTRHSFADGRAFVASLAEVRNHGLPAIVPWGFGKWWFRRQSLVERVLEEAGDGLFLGDSRARPACLPPPSPMRRAAELSVPILAGSDPLPMKGLGEETKAGSYGSVLRMAFDARRPAEALRRHLLLLRERPPVFGRRVSLVGALQLQLSLRLHRYAGGRP